jgi:tetratricopeptide (TPR) repeat protein
VGTSTGRRSRVAATAGRRPPGARRLTPVLAAALLGALLGYVGLGSGMRAPAPAADPGAREDRRAAATHDAVERAAPVEEAYPRPEPATAGPPDGEPPLTEAERANREAVARADAGDFNAAAALLRDALAREPENARYRGNLQAALINAGFADVEAEHFDAAVGHFVEAMDLGDRGEIRRGLGYAYYRLGKLELAEINLARALTLQEGDAETYLTLGRIYLEKRDHQRAREMLERAVAAGADQPGLADTVARLEREAAAEEGFHALESSHFVLKFEGRENTQVGRLVLNLLEEAYRTVGARFAYYPLDRVEVVLYPDETFREVTNSPHWSGAVYDGRIKMPIGGVERGSERLRRTLRHEYAHAAIVTLSRGKAPVWLNEGLAQVAEEPEESGRLNRLRLALAEGPLPPLATLERDFTGLDSGGASLAYAEAYFAARYLLDKKGSYNVRRLLEALATAADVDAALHQALSLSYEDLDRGITGDLRRRLG